MVTRVNAVMVVMAAISEDAETLSTAKSAGDVNVEFACERSGDQDHAIACPGSCSKLTALRFGLRYRPLRAGKATPESTPSPANEKREHHTNDAD